MDTLGVMIILFGVICFIGLLCAWVLIQAGMDLGDKMVEGTKALDALRRWNREYDEQKFRERLVKDLQDAREKEDARD